MRRIMAFMALAVMGACYYSNAEDFSHRWKFGVCSGLNLSREYVVHLPSGYQPPKTAPILNEMPGGLTVEYSLSAKLSLKSGILYEYKGFKSDSPTSVYYLQPVISGTYVRNYPTFITAVTREKLGYVIVPLVLQYNYQIQGIRLFANAGTYGGYLPLADRSAIKFNDGPYPVYTQYSTGNMKRFDGGFCGGGGFSVNILKAMCVGLEVRYSYTLAHSLWALGGPGLTKVWSADMMLTAQYIL